MKAVTIMLGRDTKDLEGMLGNSPALKKISNCYWKWECPCGSIGITIFENPYSVEISAQNTTHITQKRVIRLSQRIRDIYKDCKIENNKDFFY